MDNHRNYIGFLDQGIMLVRNPKEPLKPFLYTGEMNQIEMDMSLSYSERIGLRIEMLWMLENVKLEVGA